MDVAACARIDNEAAEAGISITAVHMSESAWAALNNIDGHSPHWIFGSPKKPIDSRILETDMHAQGNPSFKEFDERLRNFLSLCLPVSRTVFSRTFSIVLRPSRVIPACSRPLSRVFLAIPIRSVSFRCHLNCPVTRPFRVSRLIPSLS